MQTLRPRSLALVALLALASTAATCPKARTPEGTIALYGTRIATTVGAAQEAIGAVGKTTQSDAVRKGALAALDGLGTVNRLGVDLAGKLEAIANARSVGGAITEASVQDALKLIDAIDAAIDLNVIPKLGDHPETTAAIQAAREIGKLILTIQFELGRLQ